MHGFTVVHDDADPEMSIGSNFVKALFTFTGLFKLVVMLRYMDEDQDVNGVHAALYTVR